MTGRLDLRRLRYFLAIAETGSISAAARALNLAQPALSYHVAELERLTGHALFVRSREGVALTEAGAMLLPHARDIAGRVEAAERAMAAHRPRADAVRIRVAVIASLAADLTPLLAARVAASMPGVSLHLIEAGTREITRKLVAGEADMAVSLAPAEGSVDDPFATEQLFFLSAAGTDRPGPFTLAEVAARRLVLPARGNPLRDFADDAARRDGLRLDVVLEVDGARSRRNAVLSGIGGTILGAHAVRGEGADPALSVHEIVSPRLFRPIYLGLRRDFDTDLGRAMIVHLRAALEALGLQPAALAQAEEP